LVTVETVLTAHICWKDASYVTKRITHGEVTMLSFASSFAVVVTYGFVLIA
jgi:hypothetical protein